MLLENTIKNGIETLKTVEEKYCLDEEYGTDYWRISINKEMNTVQVLFKFKGKVQCVSVGYGYITCNTIFDLDMDLTRNLCYVEVRYHTKPP